MFYSHYSEIPADDWKWPHFRPAEIACPHCGEIEVMPNALNRLEAVRFLYDAPILLASAYRCQAKNIAVGGAPNSPHLRGTAFDPYPGSGGDLARMEDCFFAAAVLGRGKGLKGDPPRLHLHFDWDDKLGRRSWGY